MQAMQRETLVVVYRVGEIDGGGPSGRRGKQEPWDLGKPVGRARLIWSEGEKKTSLGQTGTSAESKMGSSEMYRYLWDIGHMSCGLHCGGRREVWCGSRETGSPGRGQQPSLTKPGLGVCEERP